MPAFLRGLELPLVQCPPALPSSLPVLYDANWSQRSQAPFEKARAPVKPLQQRAELVVETTGKSARFQAAQTVPLSPPALLSNLSRHNGAPLSKARIQAPTLRQSWQV